MGLAVLLAGVALAASGPPSTSAVDGPKGHLILIGGGEVESPAALLKMIELAGGKEAPIVVIPTASEEPDAAEYYTRIFTEKGCTNVTALRIKTREDAARPDYVEAARQARGIFFGGGDQVRITDAILDTPVGDAVGENFRRGGIVGGTSAGTACQSALMITGEGDFTVIRGGAVELKRGFGLAPADVIVDQHFVKRQRENRLITVLLEHPGRLGVAVDEDTAAWIKPDGTFEVLGDSSVVVLDPAGAAVRRGAGEAGKELLGVRGMTMHILLRGDRYDLRRRAVLP